MNEKPKKHPLVESVGELIYLLSRMDAEALEDLRKSLTSYTITNCCWTRYGVAQFLMPHVMRNLEYQAAVPSGGTES